MKFYQYEISRQLNENDKRRRVRVCKIFEEKRMKNEKNQNYIWLNRQSSYPNVEESETYAARLEPKKLNRRTLYDSVTVKNRELRATNARAFIKIRRQVLLKENNHLARIMADLHATEVPLSFSIFLVYRISSGQWRTSWEILRQFAHRVAPSRDTSRRVASRHLVPSCRDAIRLYKRIFMPLYSIILIK